MKYTELFSFEDLGLELQNGYVREVRHPSLPLTIFNYTEKAQFDSHWNDVTKRCRGLIVDYKDEIVARGPRKFFNYGQPGATNYPLSTPVRVSRKEDGSLGIGWYYVDPDDESCDYGYATRGSFTSEQAKFANLLFAKNKGHNGRFEILPDVLMDYSEGNVIGDDGKFTGRPSTDIVEIVYPDNKIVLDYKGREDLIPLGMVDNESGLIVWRSEYKEMTLGDALALPIPEGEEGYVLDILVAGEVVDHLKLKGDWYKRMHSAIFGLTEKKVWEAWKDLKLSDFIAELPDELQPWTIDVATRIQKEANYWEIEVRAAEDAMTSVLGYGASRKDQAEYLLKYYKPFAPGVFALLDDNADKLDDWISKQIKPKKHVPFNTHDVQHPVAA